MERRIREILLRGVVIPASPLALNRERRFDPRGQRALWRYYSEAGAGGIAVGVHTTQFAIRDPKVGLFRPLLELAREVFDELDRTRAEPLIRVAGVCGPTEQALREAELARELGFHAGLLSLSAMRGATLEAILDHCRKVAEVIPLFGFYLQPAVGGIVLPFRFWRALAEVENLAAIKIAPFNRYQTLDVVRAIAEAGRQDVALYTGNDDNIVVDLLTRYRFVHNGKTVEGRIVGGLLGHWAVWTRSACQLLRQCHEVVESGQPIPQELLTLAVQVTDMNAALFDVANNFRGCIAGVQEVLRRQGLLESNYCLDPEETLSPGQAEELDRVCAAYPHLVDDQFVAENRDRWLSD